MNMRLWNRMLGRMAVVVLSSLLTLAAAGCTDKKEHRPETGQLAGTIKFMGFQSGSYSDLLVAQFPDVNFEDVSIDYNEIKNRGITYLELQNEVISSKNPDVLTIYSIADYDRMSKAGKLYDLTAFLREDKYDTSDILPIVTDTLKAKGGGRIYGLAPSFSNSALYYNKSLFDKYGVPYPKDQMSWREVLELAGKFPRTGSGDSRIYGFHQGFIFSPKDFLFMVARTYGLNYLSVNGKNVTIDTPQWKEVIGLVMDAYRNGVLAQPMSPKANGRYEKADIEQRDLFGAGRAAMTLDTFFMNNTTIDWGMVTVPVDPALPNRTTSLMPSPIFAIGAKAANPREAWEIVKFINSAQVAKIQQKTDKLPGYSSRMTLLPKEKDGRSMEPLYKLTQFDDRSTIYNPELPQSFYDSFNKTLDEELDALYQGDKTVEAAVKELQAKGQEALR